MAKRKAATRRRKSRRPGVPCPFCECRLSYVIRTTLLADALHRRRKCDDCGRMYTSKELSREKVTDMSALVRNAMAATPPRIA